MLSYVNLRSFALLELLMRIFEAIFDFKGPFASMHIIDWIVWVDGKVVCFRSFAHDLRTSQCSVPRDPSNFHLRLLQRVTHTLPSNPVHTSTYEGVAHTRIQAIQSRGMTLVEPLVSFELDGAVAVYVNIIIVISGVR